MLPRIVKAEYVDGYKVRIVFSNGVKTEMDFSDKIIGRGGVFAPLENPEYFKKFSIDSEAGTIVWPNGVDFCPDALYSKATGEPFPNRTKSSARK